MQKCADIVVKGLKGQDARSASVCAKKELRYVNGAIMNSEKKEKV